MTVVGKIVKIKGKKGIAEVEGKKREIDLSLVSVKAGDFVSCALSLAVEKLEKKEALLILRTRAGLSEAK